MPAIDGVGYGIVGPLERVEAFVTAPSGSVNNLGGVSGTNNLFSCNYAVIFERIAR